MNDRLDSLIQELKAEAPDRDLRQLEPAVWGRLAKSGAGAAIRTSLLPLRTAAVLMALVIGAAVGGASATAAVSQASETSVFGLNARLAPSTLLGSAK